MKSRQFSNCFCTSPVVGPFHSHHHAPAVVRMQLSAAHAIDGLLTDAACSGRDINSTPQTWYLPC